MNQAATLQKALGKPLPAAAAYACVMLLALFVIGGALADMLGKRAEVAAARAMLEQFEGRKTTASHGSAVDIQGPAGSPFLDGATVTVAGAALLQRVSTAVTRLGGNVLSSQIDLQGTQAKAGFVTVIANCEIDQPGLQKLLYDVEAGMPFLFVDQLSVQAPAGASAGGEGKLRVLIAVSGQWQGAK
ncbi:type II secretion system protein GspM [Bradyrhizobium sp.]|uniref:type II secretion system protein GspM n=1 Tax=Bradyrhizobium sp. TaxID=376 RepID=UPI001EBDC24A|nr:type II secretion system protein GspM [Bradyrhizobium sp.]MBV8919175.1 type II secretion system protein M [Bradyrhizobium sp.]MBV9980933.1 type II secretion system protein M [Bradyrhizobium sp.]